MSDIIRGPEDKAQFRDHPTEWTGYIDPLPACDIAEPFTVPRQSVSEVKKAWPKFLTDWAAKEAAKSAWKHRDAIVKMDEDEAVDLISPASNRSRNKAAARGHQIHDLLEHFIDDVAITVYDEMNPAFGYVDCLRLLVETEKPKVVASEVVVVGPDAVGTFDAVWDLDGELALVDYKSRKEGKAATRYPEDGVQEGGYLSADYWIVEDESGIHRMKPLNVLRAIIVSIAPDGYRIYEVDPFLAKEHWRKTVAFKETMDTAKEMFSRPRGINVPKETASDAKPARIEPVGIGSEYVGPDEGDIIANASDDAAKAISKRLSKELIDRLGLWVKDGDAAHRPWRLSALESHRRFTLYRGATRLLELCDGDGDPFAEDIARQVIALVIGEELQPAMTIGMALGAMTIAEAERLVEVTDTFIKHGLTFADDGRPTLAVVA